MVKKSNIFTLVSSVSTHLIFELMCCKKVMTLTAFNEYADFVIICTSNSEMTEGRGLFCGYGRGTNLWRPGIAVEI